MSWKPKELELIVFFLDFEKDRVKYVKIDSAI